MILCRSYHSCLNLECRNLSDPVAAGPDPPDVDRLGPPSSFQLIFNLFQLASIAFNMWDDQPFSRPNPSAEMPPPTRAFLSQFNRSFTPPALINDPYVFDRKLTVTPFLFGTRPLHKPRNPLAIDPAVERAHHYRGLTQAVDAELCPSPRLSPIQDDKDEDWSSDEKISHALGESMDFVHQEILCI